MESEETDIDEIGEVEAGWTGMGWNNALELEYEDGGEDTGSWMDFRRQMDEDARSKEAELSERGKHPRRRCAEYELQASFFSWIRRVALTDERFHLIYSVPNDGAQSLPRRGLMYRMGLMRGVSDINVDLPSHDGKYGYLRIELKSETGYQMPDQKEYERLVGKYGNGLYVICRSIPEIIAVFTSYFGDGYDWDALYATYGSHDRRPKSLRRFTSMDGMDEIIGSDFVQREGNNFIHSDLTKQEGTDGTD